uniref:Thiazole synthase n=1 Tax=Corynoplastis japonica TaxID=700918 RepID=A0A1X9PU44_9RHOD|nr:thiazole biosynthesis protein ThiG [Corynoplastis japonica]
MNNRLNFDSFSIGHKSFNSRLMLGTGKYKTIHETQIAINMSDCEIVTVAIRRAQNFQSNNSDNLINMINWNRIWILPNTAGCKTAEEAIRVASLGREVVKKIGQEDNNFIKLEVISDSKYLLPDPIGTLRAAEFLVKKGFTVLPYISPDPILAKQLEEIGCATVMPLGSPIGSGQGLKNIFNLQLIIENAKIPIIIDAGIGCPSEAAHALELGATAVLVNTAVARAKSSILMANAMKLAVSSGRSAYIAGRMSIQQHATASSTNYGVTQIKN